MISTITISLLVKNRPGVLAAVSTLLAGLDCNIEALKIGRNRHPGLARMRIAADVEDGRLESLLDQIGALADVLRVRVWRNPIKKWGYAIIAYGLWVVILGVNLASPLYSMYIRHWGLSEVDIALVFSTYAFVVISTIVLFGKLAVLLGPRSVLLTGLIFALIGTVCFALADGLIMLLVARIFQGVSVGMFNGVSVMVLTELHRERNHHQAAITAAFAVTTANALGPLLSGTLAEFAPYPSVLPFGVYAGLIVIGLIGFMMVRIRGYSSLSLNKRQLFPNIPAGERLLFYTAAMTSFTAWSMVSLFMSLIPSYMNRWIDMFGSGFLVAGVTSSIILVLSAASQFALRNRPLKNRILYGYVFLGIGNMAFMFTLATGDMNWLFAAALFTGMGHGPLYSGSLAAIQMNLNMRGTNDMVSLYYVITYFGVAVPVLGAGYAAQIIGLNQAIFIFTIVMSFLGAINFMVWKYGLDRGI